jgi:hypothetical protein
MIGTKIVNIVRNLIIIILKINVFKVMTISMWQINILTNNHFQMEDDKICEVGHFLNFHSKHLLVD